MANESTHDGRPMTGGRFVTDPKTGKQTQVFETKEQPGGNRPVKPAENDSNETAAKPETTPSTKKGSKA